VRSVPRLYNEEQLRLLESLETAVRRVGVSYETIVGQQGRGIRKLRKLLKLRRWKQLPGNNR
jgi:hypothetical protein